MVTALIDGDLIAYINAASAEEDSQDIAIGRTDHHIRDILDATGAEKYKIFISGGNNFRYEVNPMYKANRTQPDPIHREACKDFLITEWKASVTDGYEADDALGIAQNEGFVFEDDETGESQLVSTDTIICSIDKDLNIIPGYHYSWPILRKGVVIREAKTYFMEELEGIKHFYKQMLIGDTVDNIIGVKGIGKVKAAQIIDPMTSEKNMFRQVSILYGDKERFWMNANCLWIMQREGEKFEDRYGEKK